MVDGGPRLHADAAGRVQRQLDVFADLKAAHRGLFVVDDALVDRPGLQAKAQRTNSEFNDQYQ